MSQQQGNDPFESTPPGASQPPPPIPDIPQDAYSPGTSPLQPPPPEEKNKFGFSSQSEVYVHPALEQFVGSSESLTDAANAERPPGRTLSIVSVSLAGASLLLMLFVGGFVLPLVIAAIITGHQSLKRIQPNDSSSKAMAMIGMIAGYVLGAVALLFVAFAVFVVVVWIAGTA